MDPLTALTAIPGIGPVLPYVALAVAVCSALATVLPAPGPGASPAWVAIYRGLNLVGANFGRAANHDDVAAKTITQGTKP